MTVTLLILSAARHPAVLFWFTVGLACGVGLYLALMGYYGQRA